MINVVYSQRHRTYTLQKLFTLNFNPLTIACDSQQAEMMWRKRSHDPSIDSQSEYCDTPEEFETVCRYLGSLS